MNSTRSAFFSLALLSHSSCYTKPWHVRHQWLVFPRWKLVEEACNDGGLAATHHAMESGHVFIQTSMQKPLISLPDVELKCKARYQIRVRGGALIDQFQTRSDFKRSGERLCDYLWWETAEDPAPSHLRGQRGGWQQMLHNKPHVNAVWAGNMFKSKPSNSISFVWTNSVSIRTFS